MSPPLPDVVAADVALALASGGRAESTQRAYASALRQLRAWCAASGREVSELGDLDLAHALGAAARGGAPGFPRRLGPARLRVVVCALRAAYASRGLPDPVGPASSALLRQLAREAPAPRLGALLRPQDVRALVAWARRGNGPWWLGPLVVVAWGAALRAGELRDAGNLVEPGVVEVRGKRGSRRIRLPRGRPAYLDPVACAAQLAAGGGLPTTRAIADALRRAFRAVGLEGATAHSFRRGWATTAALAGVPLTVVAARLGHSDLRSLTRYAQGAGPPPPVLL